MFCRKDHRRLTQYKRCTLVIDFIGSTCDSSWIEVNDTCFGVFAGTSVAKDWFAARESCLQLGSDLAVVDSEIERKIIADHLTNIANRYPGHNVKALLGIRNIGRWYWLDGSNISASIWHSGYPDVLKTGECGLLAKSSREWKLDHVPCRRRFSFICETDERKSFVMVKSFQGFSFLIKFFSDA